MADEAIGTAYVNVKPKVDDGFSREIEEKATPAGHGFGAKFSSAASKGMTALSVAAGNILANLAANAAAAIGDAFADMITGAMEYEQLAGGVEKIFDEANIDQILRDANAAYRDLNMSANEYLASINQTGAAFAQTMGDQKGYETARKGMLAISDYASGTGRSIDELNDKYALITRSTSSYQSIADQFAGILPATSKDFLEQAQAAGYLSKEYKSLTEVPVAEYQEAVTKMLEKGVDDMGLAGNTAAESASTMSGSLAMLQSSWSNLLTSMMSDNADFDASFDALMESVSAVIDNFAPKIGTLLANIVLHLPDFIEVMGEAALQLILAFVQGLVEGIGPAMDAMEEVVTAALDAAGEAMMNGIMSIGEFLGSLMDGIVNTFKSAWDTICSTVDSAVNTVQNVITAAMAAAQSIIDSVWSAIQNTISSAVNAVKGAIDGLSSIVGVVTNIFNQVKQAITNPIETAKGIIRDAINTIKSIINGAHLELPHFKLPHFNINGGELPWGIGGQGTPPSISVDWYASGGFVNGATLIGAGEAGPEMILPAQGGLMDDFADAVASQVDTAAVVDEIRRFERMIGPIIADYAPQMNQREFGRAVRGAVAYG